MTPEHTPESCMQSRMAINDALEVLSGKWKLIVLITLQTGGSRRFRQLAREIGITPRMLSKELQDMETNKLITRTELDTRPVTVEYAITDYGRSLGGVMEALRDWGSMHRAKIMHGVE